MMGHRGTFAIPPLVNFAHFRKVNVLAEAKSNQEGANSAALRSEQYCVGELGELEVANAALLFLMLRTATGFLMHQVLSAKTMPMQLSGLRCLPSAFHSISP
jgi:hypothetical protein